MTANLTLHNELLELRKTEKRITSEILEKLQLMENTRDYLRMGYSSLFDYLVRGLNYSESTAYQRQACVRLTKDLPEVKQKIDQGCISLSAITTAYKHIRTKPLEEKREVLKSIENKPIRDVRKIFAEPIKPIKIQKTEYKDKVYLRLELSHEQNKKLNKLQALKSHSLNLEELLESLIDQELKKYENTNFKSSKSSNPRQISQTLRNHVLKNSNYKCQHPGCESTHFLQIDHKVPVRMGGKADINNLQVLCSAHNQMKG